MDSGIKLRLACVQMNGVSVNGCQSAPCLVGAGSKGSGMGDKSRVTKKKKVENLKGTKALSPLQVTPEALGSRRQ
jgi:hypothetical protein